MSLTTQESPTNEVTEPDSSVVEPVDNEQPDSPLDVLLGEAMTKDLKLVRPSGEGFLTFRADQTSLAALDEEQKAAISSFGLSLDDERVWAHLRRFIHVIGLTGLDPWANEIYLVERGKGDKRNWTIQIGIDGYRKRARRTGRWVGTAEWRWTGTEDDAKDWRESTDPLTGDIVMRRVWWENWPISRGNPGAAKAVVQVIGEDGVLRVEEFVASWEMFAAYEDVWEGEYGKGKRKLNPDGSVAQKLAKNWGNGKGPHMLGKCAEANILRQCFQNIYYGIRSAEEMERVHAEEKSDIEDVVARTRRERHRAAMAAAEDTQKAVSPNGAKNAANGSDQALSDVLDLTGSVRVDLNNPVITGTVEPETEPVRLADAITDTIVTPLTEDEKMEYLLNEIDWATTVLGQDLREPLAKRAKKETVEEMTSAELLGWVGPFRAMVVVPRLREAGRHFEADAYESWGPEFIGPLNLLRGLSNPGTDTPPDPDEDSHPFVPEPGNDAQCDECGGYEDDPVHPATVIAPAA